MYFEPDPAWGLDPSAVLKGCVESGAQSVLLDETALPPEFFELRSGVAGELLQKLANYRIRLAGVVPAPGVHSRRFQEFLREANRGTWSRFFATRQEAIDWLEPDR